MAKQHPVTKTVTKIPALPLRDVVVYPYMVIPLFVGRDKSIQALEAAMAGNKQIMLIAQKDPAQNEPEIKDLYDVGTLSNILQLLKLPDGTVKVLVEGSQRAHITKFSLEPFFEVDAKVLEDEMPKSEVEMGALVRSVISQFDQYVKINKKIPPEILSSLTSIDDPSRLADTIVAHMSLKLNKKQELLERNNVVKRLEHLLGMLEVELDLLQVEKRIRGRVKRQMERSQREYYLNEQMKAIQKELGGEESELNEIQELAKKIENSGMPKEAQEKAKVELNRLKMMPPMSAESTVCRNYLDWMLMVPWKASSKINTDLVKAEDVLNHDHYGLEKVKERIVEYLAVQQRVKKLKGPILCLVGPPGVGKTSLGRSIAKAVGREYVRMSLGGVRDEAEIRGHRRTYIGALPGKIIQKMTKAEVKNPLFLLDEVDKMAMDFRGDPASALLEVLDPEQNNSFNDHYLEVDYDLSDVMFIATANSLNIPAPLLDRMEVIRIPGYTEDEKLHIAKQHLIPKQMSENGLKPEELNISDQAILGIIRHYTQEAGVRNLEREISKITRRVVKDILINNKAKDKKAKANRVEIKPNLLERYLGVQKFNFGKAEKENRIGQATGLAWTQVGGELLTIEAVSMPGKGRVIHTGSLGDVMKESIQAALSVMRTRQKVLGIAENYYEKHDTHIHVPEGATPKDGPSAGIAICTAVVSAITGIPVRANVAMTGEITLRGEVLPIGGLKEKLLAAHRGGIEIVLIPEENKRGLAEIPDNIKNKLDIRPVKWIDQVLDIALQEAPKPLGKKGSRKVLVKNKRDAKKGSSAQTH